MVKATLTSLDYRKKNCYSCWTLQRWVEKVERFRPLENKREGMVDSVMSRIFFKIL